jgi:hypothetical protein
MIKKPIRKIYRNYQNKFNKNITNIVKGLYFIKKIDRVSTGSHNSIWKKRAVSSSYNQLHCLDQFAVQKDFLAEHSIKTVQNFNSVKRLKSNI